jgi:hypothetical protein
MDDLDLIDNVRDTRRILEGDIAWLDEFGLHVVPSFVADDFLTRDTVGALLRCGLGAASSRT